ncbi:hypothetical protein HPP92_016333 [Vanilla planifolia]|uniref:Exocyst complex component SEC5 n=1 Tax=Vanilla planifolia TaxID=51239 RepID=A0A835URZ0_VANPL|nr:hypothetical protein HPP92_016333 [Vanilla planifolia]
MADRGTPCFVFERMHSRVEPNRITMVNTSQFALMAPHRDVGEWIINAVYVGLGAGGRSLKQHSSTLIPWISVAEGLQVEEGEGFMENGGNGSWEDGRWRSLSEMRRLMKERLYMTGEEFDALRGRYIHMLTAVLIHHIPSFWRLALSVFSGKFAKVTAGNVALDSDVNAKHARSRSEEKAGDMKFESYSG